MFSPCRALCECLTTLINRSLVAIHAALVSVLRATTSGELLFTSEDSATVVSSKSTFSYSALLSLRHMLAYASQDHEGKVYHVQPDTDSDIARFLHHGKGCPFGAEYF